MKKILFMLALTLGAMVSCTPDAVLSDETLALEERGSGVPISLASIPQAVKDMIAASYPGYRIKEAEQQMEDAGLQYKVTIISGKTKVKLLFNASWVFIGIKR